MEGWVDVGHCYVAGIMDFVPQPTENTYEGFEDLIDRMNSWLRELRGVQVINIQSVMVQKHDGTTRTICVHAS